MKRNNTTVDVFNPRKLLHYQQRTAFHEAGHATAIYLGNSQKNLPPVFFQILFKDLEHKSVNSQLHDPMEQYNCVAKIKGGQLIQTLSIPFDGLAPRFFSSKDDMDSHCNDNYRLALEADIVNLLVGPLAEAKYVASTDGETFSSQLLPVQALKNYGGHSDLVVVNDYLQIYTAYMQEQGRSLNQFLMQAFNFVNDSTNWKAITKLANYILTNDKNVINCEEVATVLDGIG